MLCPYTGPVPPREPRLSIIGMRLCTEHATFWSCTSGYAIHSRPVGRRVLGAKALRVAPRRAVGTPPGFSDFVSDLVPMSAPDPTAAWLSLDFDERLRRKMLGKDSDK